MSAAVTPHVLVTGVTGFLGQAILERLVSVEPAIRITVLIRPKGTLTGEDRLMGLLRKPVFRAWVEKAGGRDEARRILAEKVSVLETDLGDLASLPDDLTTVVHSASTVSFDPPIDEAFDTNVGGAKNLYTALLASKSRPHVIHVSTAYVGGLRKGVLTEEPLRHSVDWRVETSAASRARREVEASSRQPELLNEALRWARGRHGKAGPRAISQAAESYRVDWVRKRLVEYGRARARSLGWPDVYAFTKAMAERVAENLWASAGNRLSVVRPSIVESALKHPYPGWIDGFKVADPLILAYGRGVLSEFPGLPDSVLDIIPVDFVVNAILVLVESQAPIEGDNYFHVTSGSGNPLLLREMYENMHTYFGKFPAVDGRGTDVAAPIWTFPGRHKLRARLRAGERGAALAESALLRLPASERTRGWIQEVMGRQNDLEVLRNYSELYEAYTEAEIIYDDAQVRSLGRSRLESAGPDAVDYGFDVTDIDWTDYFQEVHFPGITKSMRSFSSRPRAIPASEGPLIANPAALAIFDLEGTVVSSNTVEHYLWLRLVMDSKSGWLADIGDLALNVPKYLRAEDRDRGEFIRTFMRRYAGADVAVIRKLMNGAVGDVLKSRMRPEALRRIEQHRAAGHRTVLVTGTVDAIVAPLEPYFDDIISGSMHEADGKWTGYLSTPPLVDEARAAWLARYAKKHNADLSQSYAYGDSHADRSWLELVGHPRVVNPDPELFRHAVSARWEVENWQKTPLTRLGSLRGSFRARADRPGQ